jgi:SNF2 family DNA or RNA helicase
VHRLGQTAAVRVWRLFTRGSIEAHLAAVAEGKGEVAAALMELSEGSA